MNQLQQPATTPATATSSQVETTEPYDSRKIVFSRRGFRFRSLNSMFDQEFHRPEAEVSAVSISA